MPGRPALTAAGAADELERIAERREPHYRALAGLVLDSSRAGVEELARALERALLSA